MKCTGAESPDYCTNFPDFVWGHCCAVHDIAYTMGFPRVEADLNLALCILKTGFPLVAFIVLIGVRFFGHSYYRRSSIKE